MGQIYDNIVSDLRGLGYDFRINDLDDTIQVSHNGGSWQPITEEIESTIRIDLRELGYGKRKKPSLSTVKDAWVKLASEQRHNPIKEYFLSLDGKYEPSGGEPYINELFCKFFDNPDGMFPTWLFKWMTGTIAKVFEGARNPMLVLVSEQRQGKSYFARWLCPINRDKYFIEKSINPDSKDDKFRLLDKIVWEVPELGATTTRQNAESLKAFITTRQITERKSYGKYPIHKRAVCSFIGSVNYDGAGFLNDPTGSTRFLACELSSIHFKYTIQKIDELWAEAYWFYRNVPKCWELTPEQQARQAQINASFEMVSALEEAIENYFDITLDDSHFLTTQQIKNHLSGRHQIGNENGFYRELSRILHKLKVEKTRRSFQEGKPHFRGWTGITIRHFEESED